MTDSIDLDDLEEPADEEEPDRNPGDWFWREESEPASSTRDRDETATGDAASEDGETAAEPAAPSSVDEVGGAVPHVPRENRDKPIGIPMETGGAGGGSRGEAGADPPEAGDDAAPDASGPHGGDADEMTLAFTYAAVRRLASPAASFAEAETWTDWLGIVGDVPSHVINKFQRDNGLDADFFSGANTGPTERLAEVDRRSMFYAERLVLVGTEEQAELAPDGWEFLPLRDAAEKAGWDVE